MKILIIHGPNLNLLGTREPQTYGFQTLDDINNLIGNKATELGVEVAAFQSNSEGEIVDCIQKSRNDFDGIIINAAAYTHTSVAIRDAIIASDLPAIEVHLSNIHSREEFRHHSYLADICMGQICGFKADSYILALEGMVNFLKKVH